MSSQDYSPYIKNTVAGFTTAKDFAENVGFNKKTILYVGGLDEKVDEEVLQGVFQPFGELVCVLIPRDQGQSKHRGFGFVEFEDPEDAKHAMENMQDSELYGRVIKCNIAKPNALKAKAVWDEADKWYERALAENPEAVSKEMRHKEATDTDTKTDGKAKDDVKDEKNPKDQKQPIDSVPKPDEKKTEKPPGHGGKKKKNKNKKRKGKDEPEKPKSEPSATKSKAKATVSFEDVFGRYFIYT